jgi:hypothetical protein
MSLRSVADEVQERVLRALGKGEIVQKIRQEQTAAELAERKPIVARLAGLRAKLSEQAPLLAKATATAAGKLAAARAAAAAAEQAYWDVLGAERQGVTGLENAIRVDEGALRATASPRIAELRSELRGRLNEIHTEGPSRFTRRAFNPIAGKERLVLLVNDRASRLRAMDAITSGLLMLDQLELEALAPEVLEARLARILEEIPELTDDVLIAPRPGDSPAA